MAKSQSFHRLNNTLCFSIVSRGSLSAVRIGFEWGTVLPRSRSPTSFPWRGVATNSARSRAQAKMQS